MHAPYTNGLFTYIYIPPRIRKALWIFPPESIARATPTLRAFKYAWSKEAFLELLLVNLLH